MEEISYIMGIINKIKLPNDDIKDIGALSSNIIYNGVTPVITLNQKIENLSAVATTTTAGLMSAQDKKDLDRLKISGSTPVTISGDDSIEIQDASEDSVQQFIVNIEPNITIVPGKNLANPETNVQGYYIGANGTMTAQAGDWYTALIPVSVGDHIYVSGYHNQTDNGNKRLHGYNASGTWVRQLNYAAVPAKSTLPAYYATDAVIPSGVAYVRFSYRMQDTQVMIQINTQDPYEPYGEHYQFNIYTGPLTIM